MPLTAQQRLPPTGAGGGRLQAHQLQWQRTRARRLLEGCPRSQRRSSDSISTTTSTTTSTTSSNSSSPGSGGGQPRQPRAAHAASAASAATSGLSVGAATLAPRLQLQARTLALRLRRLRRRHAWDAAADTGTRLLVQASVLPALALALQPQPPPGLACWQGPLRDMFSFTVLLSVFIGCEPGAAAASAASAAGGALALASIRHALPWPAACTAAAVAAASAGIIWAAAEQQAAATSVQQASQPAAAGAAAAAAAGAGAAKSRARRAEWALQRIQGCLGVLGGGLLLQLCVGIALTGAAGGSTSDAVWVAAVAGGAAGVLHATRLLSARTAGSQGVRQFLDDWPAWSATLLLILQPLQQLVAMSLLPPCCEAAGGAPVSTVLLLVLASGLMVPRALHTRQLMWFTGTSSGALLAAGQGVVVALARLLQRPAAAGATGTACAAAAVSASSSASSSSGVLFSLSGVDVHVQAVLALAVGLWLLLTARLLWLGWSFILGTSKKQTE